ncbi:MAG: TIGR03086 family metal-binding protein [Acidimicrobiia bacterium]
MDSLATMDKVLQETKRVVDGIEPAQLDNPTPCTEWTVRDVLNHITAGARMFAIAAEQGSVPDDQLGELMMGDNLGDDYRASFRSAADDAITAFSAPGVLDKMVVLPFGEMPAGVGLNIAIFDVSTHTWDLAQGSGQQTQFDPDVLESAFAIAQQMMSDDLRATGQFGPEVVVADDAPTLQRLAGLCGRAF